MTSSIQSLILLIQLCTAGLCSSQQETALQMATRNCGAGDLQCVAETLDRGRVEQTDSGVTIMRGR